MFYFGSSPSRNIDYNWWGSNVYSNYVAMWGNTMPVTPHYYELKLRQLSATVIELSLNSLHDGTPLHDGAVIIRNGRIYMASCVMPLSAKNSLQ